MNLKTKNILAVIIALWLLGFAAPSLFSQAASTEGQGDSKNPKLTLYYLKSGSKTIFLYHNQRRLYQVVLTKQFKGESGKEGAAKSKVKTANNASKRKSKAKKEPEIEIITSVILDGKVITNSLDKNIKPIYNKIVELKGTADSFDSWREGLQTFNLIDFDSFDRAAGRAYLNTSPPYKKENTFLATIVPIGTGVVVLVLMIAFLKLSVVDRLKKLRQDESGSYSLTYISSIIAGLINKIDTDKMLKTIKERQLLKLLLEKAKHLISTIINYKKNSLMIKIEDLQRFRTNIRNLEKELIDAMIDSEEENNFKLIKPDLEYIVSCFTKVLPLMLTDLERENQLAEKLEFIKYRVHKPQSLPDAVFIVNRMAAELDLEISQTFDSMPDKPKDYKILCKEKKKIVKEFKECTSTILSGSAQDADFENNIMKLGRAVSQLKDDYEKLLDMHLIFEMNPAMSGFVDEGFTKINDLVTLFKDDYTQYSRFNGTMSQSAEDLKKHLDALKDQLDKVGKIAGNLETRDSEEKTLLTSFGQSINDLSNEKEQICTAVENLERQNKIGTQNMEKSEKSIQTLDMEMSKLQDTANKLKKENNLLNGICEDLGVRNNTLDTEVDKVRQVVTDLEKQFNTEQELVAQFNNKVEVLSSAVEKISAVIRDLENKNETGDSLYSDLTKYKESLSEQKIALQNQLDRFTEQNQLNEEFSKEIKNSGNDLNTHLTRFGLTVEALKKQNNSGDRVAKKLKEKSDKFLEDVANVEAMLINLADQNIKAEDAIKRFDQQVGALETQVGEDKTISENFGANSTRLQDAADRLVDFSSDLAPKMLKVEKIIDNLGAINLDSSQLLEGLKQSTAPLSQDVQQLDQLLKSLELGNNKIEKMTEQENANLNILQQIVEKAQTIAKNYEKYSQTFGEIEKNMAAKNRDNEEELELCREIINEGLLLNLSPAQGEGVLGKLKGEPPISREYRTYAISLHKELKLLEKTYGDQWHWQIIIPLKDGLSHTIRYFYNRDGETIYDSYLPEGTAGLRDVGKDEMRAVINQQHWGQIWDPLLRAYAFFKAYFSGELDDIIEILGDARYKIVNMMEKHLDYTIDMYSPLQSISKRLVDAGEVKDVSNPFVFYGDIFPQINNNRQLLDAETKYSQESPYELVLYVEALGLSCNNKRIRQTQLVLYSETNIKHYRK